MIDRPPIAMETLLKSHPPVQLLSWHLTIASFAFIASSLHIASREFLRLLLHHPS